MRSNWKMIGRSNYWKVKTRERVQLGRAEKTHARTHTNTHTGVMSLSGVLKLLCAVLIVFILNYPIVFKIIINTPCALALARNISIMWHNACTRECVCFVCLFIYLYTGVWIIASNASTHVKWHAQSGVHDHVHGIQTPMIDAVALEYVHRVWACVCVCV